MIDSPRVGLPALLKAIHVPWTRHSARSQLGRLATQCAAGVLGLAGLTLVGFQLHLGLATVGFAELTLIALLSLLGSFTGSIILSAIAVASLNYYFAEPLFSFRVDYPQDVAAIAALLVTSLLISGLAAGQRRSLQRHRASEQQWKEVFEHNPVMYFMLDATGTVLSVNAFGASQLGYAVDELVGQTVFKLFHPEDRELARAQAARCLETPGKACVWEIRKVRKDGTQLWVRENAKAVRRSGDELIMLLACEDITERKRGEQRLAAEGAVTGVLAASQDFDAAAPKLLQAIGTALTWDWGALWSVPGGQQELRCGATWRVSDLETVELDPSSRIARLVPGQGHPGQAWQNGQPLWNRDGGLAPGDPRRSAALQAGLRSTVAFPLALSVGGRALAVMEFCCRAPRDPDPEQLATLMAIGNQIAQFMTRKEAEKTLLQSEQRYRALFEHSYDAILLQDEQGTILYASPSRPMAQEFGYNPDELVGHNVLEFVDPDHLEAARRAGEHRRVLPPGVVRGPEERLVRRKDGSRRWVEIVATNLLHEPAVGAIVLNLRDITQRKHAQEELRESEQRFRDFAESTADWLWETGPDHRFTSFHGASLEQGAATRPLGATPWEMSADADEEPESWREHRATLAARRPFRGFTHKVVAHDGSVRYFAASGRPIFDAGGGFRGYRGVTTDVTASVRAGHVEAALGEARIQLAHMARVTALGEMTAAIAHEINQPLAAVVTDASASLHWLEGDPPDLGEARQALVRIIKDGHRASAVITRIRALVRKTPAQQESLNLNELILGVIALSAGTAQRKKTTLRTELLEGIPRIMGDRVQLQQVLLNLILNGIEAMEDGGPYEVCVATELNGSEHLLVSVRDTGKGVDPTVAARIFDPFCTTKEDGMGMGLAISRSIVEAHGGQLSFNANLPRGSVFQFLLPLTPPTTLAAATPQPEVSTMPAAS